MNARRTVVTIDLRSEAELVLGECFSVIQRKKVGDEAVGFFDLGRVLLIDTPSSIVSHADAVRRVVDSQSSVSAVICVLVGASPQDVHTGEALILPDVMQHLRLLTLWIGNEDGVVWAMGSATSSTLAFHPSPKVGPTPVANLLDALQDESIFDAVFDACGTGVASVPGIRAMVLGRGEDAIVAAAERRAIRSFVGAADDTFSLVAAQRVDSLGDLLGKQPHPEGVITATGPLGRAVAHTRDELAQARATLSKLATGPTGRVDGSTATLRVRRFGEALRGVRDLMVSVLSDVDASDGLAPTERDRIADLGIDPGKIRDAVTAEGSIDALLRTHLSVLLRSSISIDAVQNEMRAVAEAARPATAKETAQRITEILPDELIEGLVQARPFAPRVFDPVTMLSHFVAGFASGLLSAFHPVIGLLNVVVSLYVLCALSHRRLWLSPSAAVRTLRNPQVAGGPSLIAVWPLTALGGFCLGWVVEVTANLTVSVGVAGITVAALMYWLVFRLAWRRTVSGWTQQVNLEGAEGALRRAVGTIGDVALNDWALSNPRLRLSELAGGVAEALREFEVSLGSGPMLGQAVLASSVLADPLAHGDGAVSSGFEGHDLEVATVIEGDYVDIVTKVIFEGWPQFELQPTHEAAAELDTRLCELVQRYRAFRREHGLLEAPGFLGPPAHERRRFLAQAMWSTTTALRDVLNDSGKLVQLVSPEQLVFLEAAPEHARIVRFAPDAARTAVTDIADVVFSRSESVGGVMRFVPMRTGTIGFTARNERMASA